MKTGTITSGKYTWKTQTIATVESHQSVMDCRSQWIRYLKTKERFVHRKRIADGVDSKRRQSETPAAAAEKYNTAV